jgi:hypothetical protein
MVGLGRKAWGRRRVWRRGAAWRGAGTERRGRPPGAPGSAVNADIATAATRELRNKRLGEEEETRSFF